MGLDNLPNIVTIKELAEFLKLSEMMIFRAIHNGELKALKIGRRWRIEKESVIDWVKK